MKRRIERALVELGAAPPLVAVCLLAANDHQLKRLFHNALTGKLSDVAICFLLPLLVSATLGMLCDWSGRRRLTVGALVATAVFTLLELSDGAGALFVRATGALGLGGGELTRDPTDLLALLCVPLAVAYGRRRIAAAERGAVFWRTATGALVLAGGSLSLMATSPAPDCGEWTAPVVFQAEAGCGPGGVIVVEPDGYFSNVRISNAAALGLPSFTTGGPPRSSGRYQGNACPFNVAEGDWEITVEACLPGTGAAGSSGGVDGGPDAGDGGAAGAGGAASGPCRIGAVSVCRATRDGDGLWLTCGEGDAGVTTCRSRLMEMP